MPIVKTWDISGMGGGYEEACQRMFWTGVKHLQEMQNPEELLQGRKEYVNIYGICKLPESFKECQKKMLAAVNGDCTGAMMQCVTGHLKYFAENGYDKWFAELQAARKPEQPMEFDLETLK